MTDVNAPNPYAAQMPEGWALSRDGRSLNKTFQFPDFLAAIGWMSQVAQVSEEMNHHPDWRNVYRRVDVTLTTHDVGGLTSLDIILAQKMNEAAGHV